MHDPNWYSEQLSKNFEIKNRGRLGVEKGCVDETRVLNRIVRLDSTGLSYGSDPRHVGIIARGLGLDLVKKSGHSSPGLRDGEPDYTAVLDEPVTCDLAIDDEDNSQPVNNLQPRKKPLMRVAFDENNLRTLVDLSSPWYFSRMPYSSMHPLHPRYLVATKHGKWKRVKPDSNPYTGKSTNTMNTRMQHIYHNDRPSQPRARRSDILNSTARHGAKWERDPPPKISMLHHNRTLTDTYDQHTALRKINFDLPSEPDYTEHISSVRTPSARPKNQKRHGARQTRMIEMHADENDKLTAESATQYRALSSMKHYLSKDRPDVPLAAKELC